VLADASSFFEAYLWDAASASGVRAMLVEQGLDEELIRSFGVGYAPVGPELMMSHMRELGHSTDDLVAAGLATRSARGRVHGFFHSRVMFPVRDAEGRDLGFAGFGTHLGPSWPLWVTSPDVGPYRRRRAVFGLDHAAGPIASSGVALMRRDCIEVMRAHQEGRTNAVAVHTPSVTRDQMLALADGLRGGLDALQLDLPPGMSAEPKQPALPPADETHNGPVVAGGDAATPGSEMKVKRVAIVAATALAAVNLWTGAPLLAVWVGSQAQGGQVLSLRGVVTVLAVLSVFAFVLGWALSWLTATYDRLIGRPPALTRTSPWQRRMRGELDDHVRARFSLSAPERVVAACVILGVLALEVWFFFFAGSPLPT
jgi:hypothetical protein